MERRDRKRKRESLNSEEENHQVKLDSLQKNIEKAIEKVDAAKKLDENKLKAMQVGVILCYSNSVHQTWSISRLPQQRLGKRLGKRNTRMEMWNASLFRPRMGVWNLGMWNVETPHPAIV